MSLYLGLGDEHSELSSDALKTALFESLGKLGPRGNVLAVPPDVTRLHSRAGELTRYAFEFYGDAVKAILPATGTHDAMSPATLRQVFGDVPQSLFRAHNFREDVTPIGEVPGEFIREQSEGKLNYSWPAEVNRLVVKSGFDLILSIGQVVPHEVIGMANYNKNILVGTGGAQSIGRSHFLGAVYGTERIMGRADNPVRRVLNYAGDRFLKSIPIVYVLTVVARNEQGKLVVRGLFVGDDVVCFERASALSARVNVQILDRPIRKAVVYLDEVEFKSTWVGNKAIYRTRMALADDAELIVLAPGVKKFGEDLTIDKLIRKYGYRGTSRTLDAVKNNADLAADLSAAAHLIHGSSEGRFSVTYCPGGLTHQDIEGVGYRYADPASVLSRYNPANLREGHNSINSEDIFYISNPGLGLWASADHFPQTLSDKEPESVTLSGTKA